jgi:hypothetical protein
VLEVPGVAVAVIDALRSLHEVDRRAIDDDSLLGLFDGLETADRLFHAARFGMLAELDARELTDRRLGHVTANEAGWRHGTDPRRVRADATVGKTLRRDQPKLAAALAKGDPRRGRTPLRLQDRGTPHEPVELTRFGGRVGCFGQAAECWVFS